MPKIYDHTCQNPGCGKPFQNVHRLQDACCKSCAGIIRSIKAGKPPWSEAEDALLKKWAETGKYDVRAMTASLKRHAQKNDWITRTQHAVKDHLSILGLSAQPYMDNLTMAAIAKLLNILPSRVKRWQKHGMLVNRRNTRYTTVSLKSFREWAREKPVHFYGIERDRLLWLLEDESLVDLVLERSPRPKGKKMSVRRVDTGEIFPTLAAGCRAAFISQTSLNMRERDRAVVAGIEWEAIKS